MILTFILANESQIKMVPQYDRLIERHRQRHRQRHRFHHPVPISQQAQKVRFTFYVEHFVTFVLADGLFGDKGIKT